MRTRLRVVPWHGDPHHVLIGPRRDRRPPTVTELVALVETLPAVGVVGAVTPALSPRDAQVFLAAGFVQRERLHLLSRRLDKAPPSPSWPTAPGRPWHERRVLDIDGRAFDGFWRFDHRALREARRATPRSRYRVLHHDGVITGYAVCGRAGPRGYLQRLAVDPGAEGRGFGSSLVLDALGWLHASGASSVLVNTQESNHRALGLYRHLGFRPEPEGLVVLGWET